MHNHRCQNCRGLGHAAFLCPELWRRYHSTTEDVFKLTPITGAVIKRSKYCCVCGRRGHTADDCRLSGAFLDFRVAPSAIVRYQSIYPGSRRNDREDRRPPSRHREEREDRDVERGSRHQQERGKLSRRSRSSTQDGEERSANVIVEDRRPIETKEVDVPKPTNTIPEKSVVVVAAPVAVQPIPATPKEKVQVAFQVTVDVQSDERQVTSTTKSMEATANDVTSGGGVVVPYVRRMSPNSDSNYSFSDFFEKEKQAAAVAEQKLHSSDGAPSSAATVSAVAVAEDFISINTSSASSTTNNAVSVTTAPPPAKEDASPSHVSSSLPQQPTDKESDARIYLTKEHSKILINQKGSEFLQEMSERFKIRVRLEWQSIGNLLTVTGLEQNQNSFHAQLTLFLNQNDKVLVAPSMWAAPLPKKRDQLIAVIGGCIGRLGTNLGNIYDLYRRQEYSGTGRRSIKEADKARKLLNMILFGQAGLRDGQRRLGELKQGLAVLQSESTDTATTTVDEKVRENMETNFRYIFSANKHTNYGELLPRYKNWIRQRSRPSSATSTSISGNHSPAAGNSGQQQQQTQR